MILHQWGLLGGLLAMGPGRVAGGTDHGLCIFPWCLAIRSTRLVLKDRTATFGVNLANKRNIFDHITHSHLHFSFSLIHTLFAQQTSKRSAIPLLAGCTQPNHDT